MPLGAASVPTSATMSLMSAMPEVVALSRYSFLLVFSAMMFASVVLPMPEGP